MASATCPIWNTPAELWEKSGDFEVSDSPRAGGKYWISGTAVGQVLPLTDHAKRLLTTWLCEQRRGGVDTPKVTSGVLELMKSRRVLPISQRLTIASMFLGRNIHQLGTPLG
jgi:hypothetical protein